MTSCEEEELNDQLVAELARKNLVLRGIDVNLPRGNEFQEIVRYYEKFRKEVFHNDDQIVDGIEISRGRLQCPDLDLCIEARVKERIDFSHKCFLHNDSCPFFIVHLAFDQKFGKINITKIFIAELMYFSPRKTFECVPLCARAHVQIFVRDVEKKILLKCAFGRNYSDQPAIVIQVFVFRRYLSYQLNWENKNFPPRLRYIKRRSAWKRYRNSKNEIQDTSETHCKSNTNCVKNISFKCESMIN